MAGRYAIQGAPMLQQQPNALGLLKQYALGKGANYALDAVVPGAGIGREIATQVAMPALGLNKGGRVGADTFGSPAVYKNMGGPLGGGQTKEGLKEARALGALSQAEYLKAMKHAGYLNGGGRAGADTFGSPAVYKEDGGYAEMKSDPMHLWGSMKEAYDPSTGKDKMVSPLMLAAAAMEKEDSLTEEEKLAAAKVEGKMEAKAEQAAAESFYDPNSRWGAKVDLPLGELLGADWGISGQYEDKISGSDPWKAAITGKWKFNSGGRVGADTFGSPAVYKEEGGGIHIKKGNEGKFTAKAKAAGMGVQEYARHVLASDSASPATKKQANFARNAASWHKEDGGKIGPLAKTVHKTKDGESYEINYHNPLMAKPAGDKKEG